MLTDTAWLLKRLLPVHRQLESKSQWERPRRRLEKIRLFSPHQSLGAVGSQINTLTLQGGYMVLHCTSPPQCHCSILSTEGGRTCSRNLYLLAWEILQFCFIWETRLLIPRIECTSRQSIKLQTSRPQNGRSALFCSSDTCFASHTINGSVCHFLLRATSQISMSLPRPKREGGTDALSHPWDFLSMMYAYPPSPMLTAVLGRIRESPQMLLAPAWNEQP